MTSKSLFPLVLLTVIISFSNIITITAQKSGQLIIDSLIAELPKAKLDSNKVNLLNDISYSYIEINPDEGIAYGEQGFDLSNEINWIKGKAISKSNIGLNYFYKGANAEAISTFLQSLNFAEPIQLYSTIGFSSMFAGLSYGNLREFDMALKYFFISRDAYRKIDHPYLASALMNIATNYLDLMKYPEALAAAEELDEYCIEKNDERRRAAAYTDKGDAYYGLSNYPVALQNYFEAFRINEKYGSKTRMQSGYQDIAVVFQTQRDYDKALEYYNNSLAIAKEFGQDQVTGTLLSQMGSVYDLRKEYKLARSYYEQALEIYEKLESPKYLASTIYNIGGVYLIEGDNANALVWFERALKVARETKDDFQVAAILGLTGEAFRQIALVNDSLLLMKYFDGDKVAAMETALSYTDSAITLFTAQGELKNRAFYLNQKSRIQVDVKQYAEALASFKEYAQIKDSLFNIERDKKLVQAEMGYEYGRREDSLSLASTKQKLELQNKIDLQALTFEFETKQAAAQSEKEKQQLAYEEAIKRQQIENEYARKQAEAEALSHQKELERKQEIALNQAELKRQRNIRNSTLLGASGLLMFSLIVVRQRNKVKKEKARSEELLLNILPAEIAEELKLNGNAVARDFEMVSILFTDFKGFTELSAKLSASDLVSEINDCFKAFDGIMEKYGIEKIKTIGDSYMAAGGIPVPNENSIKNTVLAALEMQTFISKRKADMDAQGLPAFEMRAGIHSGPIVAGIVGVKKFQYDIWGDTVNTASRMESAGEIGKVNISQKTYELLKDQNDFIFESRGKIEAKGKGEMEMWFVGMRA